MGALDPVAQPIPGLNPIRGRARRGAFGVAMNHFDWT